MYILILLVLAILNSCSTDRNRYLENTAEASNCPSMSNEPSQIEPKNDLSTMEEGSYNAFNYRITDFAVDKDTIAASSSDYI